MFARTVRSPKGSVDHLGPAGESTAGRRCACRRRLTPQPTRAGARFGDGALDPLGDPPGQRARHTPDRPGIPAPIAAGRRVRVGRRDQHPVGGDAGLFRRQRLGPIEQFAGHHAAVDHDDDDPLAAIIQRKASRMERIESLCGGAFFKHSVDDDREISGRDVDGERPGTEDLRAIRRTRGCDGNATQKGQNEQPQQYSTDKGFHA